MVNLLDFGDFHSVDSKESMKFMENLLDLEWSSESLKFIENLLDLGSMESKKFIENLFPRLDSAIRLPLEYQLFGFEESRVSR